MRSKRRYSGFILPTVVLIVGCEPVLETGYKPRPLNASESIRRSYYAPAYTPEAAPDKKADGGDEGSPFGLGH